MKPHKPSLRSVQNLRHVRADLRGLVEALWGDGHAIEVLCGYRSRDEQEAAFKAGRSKLRFPYSKHNKMPAMAVDLAPLPIDWDDLARFQALGAVVLAKADALGLPLSWGGAWPRLRDYPHFEIDEPTRPPAA